MGIFWKAAVHSWSGSKTEPMIELGTYAETIRTWLRGETGFPKDVSLTVTLSKPESALIVLQQPVETKAKPWRTFLLNVPGVLFTLNIGENIEPDMRTCCIHQNPDHPVFVSDDITGALNARVGKDYENSGRPNHI